MVFFRNILMNGVVGKPSESALPPEKQDFHLVSGREFFEPGENGGRLIFRQH
jgi:hypothetical protein